MAAAINAETQSFFEGTEKLLEVWFSNSNKETHKSDLRNVSRKTWDELLEKVNCKILSHVGNKTIDAYVLSESSMFVSKKRFILKTCGSTTLLNAIKPLLGLVMQMCGFDYIEDVFYSHKKFIRPEVQVGPHCSFDAEVDYLDTLFQNGASYALGRLNGECWYLYTIQCPPHCGVIEPDQTLELLMTGLDPNVMRLFMMQSALTAQQATEKSGISALIPEAVIDEFMFEPCGYSMNGILPDSRYFTIHITPEPNCSYVSFESNVPQASYHGLIKKIIKVFRPERFLMTVFANQTSLAKDTHHEMEPLNTFNGFERQDHQVCIFKNYYLTYTHYAQPLR